MEILSKIPVTASLASTEYELADERFKREMVHSLKQACMLLKERVLVTS